MRRVNYIDEESDDDVFDDNEEQLVLQIDGNDAKDHRRKKGGYQGHDRQRPLRRLQ